MERICLDALCGALAYAMGIEKPEQAAEPCQPLCEYVDKAFGGEKIDRLFMYNPDAVGRWIYKKYAAYMREAISMTDIEIPFDTVMPSVTPVCFGTMYTGAQPVVHGIRSYSKPVIKIDTFFDALLRAGKRAVILGDASCSLMHIFLERDMEYIASDTEAETLARAAELIVRDEYDAIICYNGNYDSVMHKFGPESPEALAELRSNSQGFAMLQTLIRSYWKRHDTLMGFAMDHGCHEIDGGCGSHGLDMPEDIEITHLYQAIPAASKPY